MLFPLTARASPVLQAPQDRSYSDSKRLIEIRQSEKEDFGQEASTKL
jgi:hypothetical protein